MCLDPVKTILKAKKEKNMAKTLGFLIITSLIFGISSILLMKNFLFGSTALIFGVAMFLISLIFALVFGLTIQISATILGGKGKYFEGLTSITYPLFYLSIGLLAISLLSFLPFTGALNIIIIFVSFATAVSVLYRGIKELFSLDMVTTFVVVSIQTLVIVVAIYSTMMMNLGTMMGGMML